MNVIHSHSEFEIVVKDMTKNDLVFIFSLSGDTPSIFPRVETLVAKGVPFVSVTNLVNNRLAKMTPYHLYARSSTISIHNGIHLDTFASFFMIVEAIFSHYVDFINQKKEEPTEKGIPLHGGTPYPQESGDLPVKYTAPRFR